MVGEGTGLAQKGRCLGHSSETDSSISTLAAVAYYKVALCNLRLSGGRGQLLFTGKDNPHCNFG